jgi:ABC-type multidrug transport system fused ATPase/permease subunit
MAMFLRLPRLTPHLARHLGALARVGTRDAADAARVYGQSVARVAIAGVAGILALIMACILLLAAAWDTEWRIPVAGVLTVAFVAVALAMLASARRIARAATPFAATRRNLELDRELYAQLRPEAAQAPSPPPEAQLEASREEIRRLATRTRQAATTLRFPRSRTMQVLTRGGPGGSAAVIAYLMRRRRARRGA